MLMTFEPGDTKQMTFQSSVQPDSAPSFAVYNRDGTLVSSFTSTASGSFNYYAMYTMPTSEGFYVSEWIAQSTVSAVGSTFNFKKRSVFKVATTRSIQ